MKAMIKILLGTTFSLTLVNCAMFGGGEEEGYESDSSTEETSSYSQTEESDKYVAPELNQEPRDTPVIDNTSYDDSASVDSDTAFGESIDQPVNYDSGRSTSTSNFKQGMYTFNEDCQMRDDADRNGSPAGMVRAGKKLWVEPYDSNWLRVYKKSGPVYVRRSCI